MIQSYRAHCALLLSQKFMKAVVKNQPNPQKKICTSTFKIVVGTTLASCVPVQKKKIIVTFNLINLWWLSDTQLVLESPSAVVPDNECQMQSG